MTSVQVSLKIIKKEGPIIWYYVKTASKSWKCESKGDVELTEGTSTPNWNQKRSVSDFQTVEGSVVVELWGFPSTASYLCSVLAIIVNVLVLDSQTYH